MLLLCGVSESHTFQERFVIRVAYLWSSTLSARTESRKIRSIRRFCVQAVERIRQFAS